MKVILLRDVAKIGHRFDIIEVPDGYAMNKLVPQKSALPATAENVKRVRAQKDKAAAGAATSAVHFDSVVTALGGVEATLTAQANPEGGLFESVKPVKIAEALTKAAGVSVLPEYVSIPAPIKHTGVHTVHLSHGGVEKEVEVTVQAA